LYALRYDKGHRRTLCRKFERCTDIQLKLDRGIGYLVVKFGDLPSLSNKTQSPMAVRWQLLKTFNERRGIVFGDNLMCNDAFGAAPMFWWPKLADDSFGNSRYRL